MSTPDRWASVPVELQKVDRWLIWMWQDRKGKDGSTIRVKVPQGPHGNASAHDPSNWIPFGKAVYHAARLGEEAGGIGFAMAEDDDIGFIDFDGCRDPETGEIARWAEPLLALLGDAYQEVSPSGKGIKVIVRGASRVRKKQISIEPAADDLRVEGKEPGLELYHARQFTTITGDRLTGRTDVLLDRAAAWAQLESFVAGDQARHQRADRDEDPDVEEIRSALAAFTSDDLDRNQWIGIGMALKGELGVEGRELWLDWLAQSPDDEPEANDAAWDGFPDEPESIGLGTIFWHAKQHGWRPTRGEGGKGSVLAGIIDSAELWHDQYREPYATITIEHDGSVHREHHRVSGDAFGLWVQRQYWLATGGPLKRDPLREAIGLAKARGLFDGERHQTWVRVARHGDRVYVDLTDDQWRVIEIDRDGWRYCAEPPVRFRRVGGEQPLPAPTRGADATKVVEALGRLIRPKEPEHLMLVLGWMVACFCPEIPIAILLFACEYGSAKTSALRTTRAVTDPRVLVSAGLPKKEEDIVVAAASQWVMSADNVSAIPPEQSDVLCRVVTGGGIQKRKLYSDGELSAIDVKRPIVMTALGVPTAKVDFLDRSLVVELAQIDEAERLTEAEVAAMLDELKPALLGLLFDGVSTALRRVDATRAALTGQLPRMADFTIWCEAAGEAFGWEPGAFLTAYKEMLAQRNVATAADDPLCAMILTWLCGAREGEPYEEQAGAVLSVLKGRLDGHPDWFPRSPKALSGRLSERRRLLQSIGVDYSTRPHPHSRTRGRLHRLALNDVGREELRARQQEAAERPELELNTDGLLDVQGPDGGTVDRRQAFSSTRCAKGDRGKGYPPVPAPHLL